MTNDKIRLHVALGETSRRSGGLHSYVHGLALGQHRIGLSPIVVDEIQRNGEFQIASGADHLTTPNPLGIAHYHFAYTAIPFLRRRASAPWANWPSVLHFHGPWYLEGRRQGQSLARQAVKYFHEVRTLRKFPTLITASEAFAGVLSKSFAISGSRVHTVLPGVDVERFRPGNRSVARRDLGLPRAAKLAVTVRRLEPRMGLITAVEAIERTPDWHLAIVGTGSLATELQTQIDRRGLRDRVHLLGRVSDADLPKAFRAGDVSLVPTSALEGFGMIVLESFASGTPVIATNVGGLPEAMGPFASEWCIPPDNPEVLARRMQELKLEGPLDGDVRLFAESRSFEKMAETVEAILFSSHLRNGNDHGRSYSPRSYPPEMGS